MAWFSWLTILPLVFERLVSFFNWVYMGCPIRPFKNFILNHTFRLYFYLIKIASMSYLSFRPPRHSRILSLVDIDHIPWCLDHATCYPVVTWICSRTSNIFITVTPKWQNLSSPGVSLLSNIWKRMVMQYDNCQHRINSLKGKKSFYILLSIFPPSLPM